MTAPSLLVELIRSPGNPSIEIFRKRRFSVIRGINRDDGVVARGYKPGGLEVPLFDQDALSGFRGGNWVNRFFSANSLPSRLHHETSIKSFSPKNENL